LYQKLFQKKKKKTVLLQRDQRASRGRGGEEMGRRREKARQEPVRPGWRGAGCVRPLPGIWPPTVCTLGCVGARRANGLRTSTSEFDCQKNFSFVFSFW
jgi:hypothetical protein